jgi:hypothetical protein
LTQGTKLFGFRIPLDPKILLGTLFALALGLIWHSLSGGDDRPVTATRQLPGSKSVAAAQTPPSFNQNVARRADLASRSKQGTLRLKPVDPTRGDIDPTLKLWLLDRVRAVSLPDGRRNLFETGADIAQSNLPRVPKVKPIMPGPVNMPPADVASGPPQPPVVNIPLRYYGFVRPSLRDDGNRGYFMEGENILMATEGDVLESRFLVVALSPNTARVEDIQLKQGQDLQLIPEAIAQ